MSTNFSKLNLFLELFQKIQLPNCYLSISYKNQNIFKNSIIDDKINSLVYSHSLSPNYFDYLVNEENYKFNKIKQANKGFAIDMSESGSLQAYIETNMSRSSRKTIRQSVRRLEDAFKISYRMFDSNILNTEYTILFDQLRVMLDKRFEQKNEEDEKLCEWSQIKHDFYKDLKNKKATIFVIYNSNTPIGISLNYLINSIMFSWISSYNIDYAKFSLGHVDLYKHVEWCFENNIKIMELGYGDHNYKYKWCNTIYNFEHHIIYKKNSIKGVFLGKLEYIKIYVKEFLKQKGIVNFYKKIKNC